MRPDRPAALVLVALLVVGLEGCSDSPYPEVEIDSFPLAPRPPLAERPRRVGDAFRFSVASMQSPRDTHTAYSQLFERLGVLMELDIEFVQRRTYREANEMLARGTLDAALICTGGYLDMQEHHPGAIEILAVPVVEGRTTYRSFLIVPAGSRARSLADLEATRFAFTDELSLTGHLYPTSVLRERNSDPANFFSSTIFTHSHDRSVLATSRGLVDGASVDNLIYDHMILDDVGLGRRLRVIHRSPPFGMPPVVVSTRLPAHRREQLRRVLLELHEDAEASRMLEVLRFDRFVVPEEGLYESAAALLGHGT